MTRLQILIALLPVIFMLHDFEEIIMFVPWLSKERGELKRRFPKFETFLIKRGYFQLSTSGFAIAVFHEFIIVSVITYLSLWFNSYSWWFAAFMAYFLHLFVHIGQWIIFRGYVPVIVTSILTLPYCIYTFKLYLRSTEMNLWQLIFWAIIGIVVAFLSFLPAFYFAAIFEKWKTGKFKAQNE